MLLAGSNASDREGDEMLWKEMKEGNEFAFNELFERNSSILFQYGLTIIRERELIKDCIQDLFIALWLNRRNIGLARSVRYYLFFSLRRLLLKKSAKSRILLGLEIFQNRSSPDTQLAMIVDAHDQSVVKKEIALQREAMLAREVVSLPIRQREIIFLRFYQELEYKEIEEIMNLNNQAVRNILCKALKSLRIKMKGLDSEVNLAGLFTTLMISVLVSYHFFI
jgi:RNA polymerase sigma factor (sigma-70 family)